MATDQNIRFRIDITFGHWACGHARKSFEGSRYELCPACREQARRYRNHWAALALAIVLALLVVAAAVGSR